MSDSKDLELVGNLLISISQVLTRVQKISINALEIERDNIKEELVDDAVYSEPIDDERFIGEKMNKLYQYPDYEEGGDE